MKSPGSVAGSAWRERAARSEAWGDRPAAKVTDDTGSELDVTFGPGRCILSGDERGSIHGPRTTGTDGPQENDR